MVDIAALMTVLPISSLEPNWVASLYGIVEMPEEQQWKESIHLLEPPAGQHTPYIEPIAALEKLLRHQAVAPEDSLAQARAAILLMKKDIAEDLWVNFFDDMEPESPECLPISDFLAWLRQNALIPHDLAIFFEQATEVAISNAIFCGPDNWESPWSLENLPALPPPKAMIEFMPGPPWQDYEAWDDWRFSDNPFIHWREAMRPIAQALEKALGESVYCFADLNDDCDDDYVHRFLVLHWCCTWKPKSAFVQYLLKVTGAKNVEDLKTALIDPANYTHPFEMNYAFTTIETTSCSIDYLPQNTHKTVGVVVSTEYARDKALSWLQQQIGKHAYIVAPKKLATDEWIKQATHYCRSWEMRYVDDGKLNQPIDILASIDELYVIANEKSPSQGFDLKLSKEAEDLLWLALQLGIKARYSEVSNPGVCLIENGAPERVAAQKAKRTAFTRQLTEISLWNDFGSSGLWDSNGKMLNYDLLDLPFSLVKRIAAWQRDYDCTAHPTIRKDDDAWYERHDQEELEIGSALQDALGKNIPVKLYRHQNWVNIDNIEGALNTTTTPSATSKQTQSDIDYMNAIIDGSVDYANSKAFNIDDLIAIGEERMTPEIEPLFEKAVDVYAEWVLALPMPCLDSDQNQADDEDDEINIEILEIIDNRTGKVITLDEADALLSNRALNNVDRIKYDPSQVDTSGYDRVPNDEQIARQMEGLVVPQSHLDTVVAEPDPVIRSQLLQLSKGYKHMPEKCLREKDLDSNLILRATMFAARQHQNQRRKDIASSPYINHPIAVAHTLSSIGQVVDVHTLCAAILHDTIEDTDTTAAELEQLFGHKIAAIVCEVSDDKTLTKTERKQLQVEHAGHCSLEAKLVKLADKICNLRDILACPPTWTTERKIEYFDWAKQVVDQLKDVNVKLEAEFDRLYSRRSEL